MVLTVDDAGVGVESCGWSTTSRPRPGRLILASELPDEFAEHLRTGGKSAMSRPASARSVSVRRVAAEAIGTFFLVLIGPGAAMVDAWSGGSLGTTGIALAFAFVVIAMIYALGHLSGAHINPAVTLAFWSVRRFPAAEVIPYVAAQCGGAVGGLARASGGARSRGPRGGRRCRAFRSPRPSASSGCCRSR